jgi:hypothetical protein
MGFKDGFKSQILPELISVSEFTILEPIIIIMFQSMIIDIPVIGKLIGKTIITPMTIAKKNKL